MDKSVANWSDEPIGAPDVLTRADLLAPDDNRSNPLEARIRETGVVCGRPLPYPVPNTELPTYLRWRAEATGHRHFGVLFLFDLDELGLGRRYRAARFTVRIDDERITAAQVHPDGGAFGLVFGADQPFPASHTAMRMVESLGGRRNQLSRLVARIGQAPARAFGAHTAEFGWAYDEAIGELPIRNTYGLHVLLEVPADVDRLRGSLSVQVELVRTMWRAQSRHHAGVGRAVPFDVPLPVAHTNGGGDTAPPTSALDALGGTAVRLCIAADVVGYSRHIATVADQTQERLVDVLRASRRYAELDEATIDLQPQGDGQFAVLPPGIDELRAIPRLIRGLRASLREINLDLPDTVRLRLRVAMHRGAVKPSANGWVGASAIAVHRILDSQPVRAAMRDLTAEFVVAVPDFLFRDVISQCFDFPKPDDFRDVIVEIPEKGFVERAWIFVSSRCETTV
jgi:hypothetical protein